MFEPTLVQPTAEERKLIEEARQRIADQNPMGSDDDKGRPGTFSWVGAAIALATLSGLILAAWLLFRLIL